MLAMQSVLTDPIRSSLQQLEVSPEYVPVLELVCLTEGDDRYLGEIWECRTPRVIMGDRGDADREHHESHCHIQIVADLISTLSHNFLFEPTPKQSKVIPKLSQNETNVTPK